MGPKRNFQRTLLGVAALAAISGQTQAQSLRHPVAAATDIQHAKGAAVLAIADPGVSPENMVKQFLRGRGHFDQTLATIKFEAGTPGLNGTVHYNATQWLDGVPIHGAYAKFTINARGDLIHLIDRIVPIKNSPTPPTVSPAAALDVTLRRLHPWAVKGMSEIGKAGNRHDFAGEKDLFRAPPSVRHVLFPLENGQLASGWQVETSTRKTSRQESQHQETLIGGDGKLHESISRRSNASFKVYPSDPRNAAATRNEPAAVPDKTKPGTVPSPAGWIDTSKTQYRFKISGNNAIAYLDKDDSNSPDAVGAIVADGTFDSAANFNVDVATDGNKAASVQNAFYHVNLIHDILYEAGFTEAKGNFQSDNFGRGGIKALANDPVLVEVQDSYYPSNASFVTPIDDGYNANDQLRPRMEIGLFIPPSATHDVVVAGVTYKAKGNEFSNQPASPATNLPLTTTRPSDGCTPITSMVWGKIVLMDALGACNYRSAVKNAQNAGAAGAIIINGDPGNVTYRMLGTDNTITIPAVQVTRKDGATLKQKANGLNRATLTALPAPPLRDGALDAGIIYHEYGHGLTWRMVREMGRTHAAKALGEGMSDAVSMLVTGVDTSAAWAGSESAFHQPTVGWRRHAYANYPLNYANVNGAEPHDDGEIYAAIMWDMMARFGNNAAGRSTLLKYFVSGLSYIPQTPTYEQARDGLLSAVKAANSQDINTANDHCSKVWAAFAKFGLGAGSSSFEDAQGVITTTISKDAKLDCSLK